MDKRRCLESVKTLLILFLTCSAIYLACRTQTYAHPDISNTSETASFNLSTADDTPISDVVRPVRIVITNQAGCYGLEYSQESVDSVFDATGRMLADALGAAAEPQTVSQRQWNQALSSTGIFYDFLGDIPLASLSFWLNDEENPLLTHTARRLLLTEDQDGQVRLWYLNSEDGQYYVCQTSDILNAQLSQMTADYTPNGSAFACLAGSEYNRLTPDQLLTFRIRDAQVYTASNPFLTGDTSSDELARTAGFNPHSLYSSQPGSLVAKDGSGTLRITAGGVATYTAGTEAASPRLSVPASGTQATLTEAVNAARSLVENTIAACAGDARVYLISAQAAEDGSIEVRFGYLLDGAQVYLSQSDCAASIVVEGTRIRSFTLVYRLYTRDSATTPLLPITLAAAAADALESTGKELLVCYPDTGDGQVQASWNLS